jgi:hypothetical protein
MSSSTTRWHHQAGWRQLGNWPSSVAVTDLVIVAGDQHSHWLASAAAAGPYLADPVLPPFTSEPLAPMVMLVRRRVQGEGVT